MVLGIGIDLVEVARVARALERHGARFEARVFTAGERSACGRRADRALAYAARFAAKEACLKALGTGWSDGLALRQVEVVRAAAGPPGVRLSGAAAERAAALGARRIHLSLSHQASMACAVVVLEG